MINPLQGDNPVTLLAVITSPGDQDGRAGVRETWGGECVVLPGCRRLFVAARSANESDNKVLKDEAGREGDIVQFGMIDSYNNLTLKTLHTLKYDDCLLLAEIVLPAFCQLLILITD